MLRSLTKDQLIKILCDRPATIRNLQKPDDRFIARCLWANKRVFDYIDASWITLPVLQAYLSLVKNSYFYELSRFPLSLRAQLPEADIRKACEKQDGAVVYFPTAPYDLYLKFAQIPHHYVGLDSIPEQYHTEEMICTLFSIHPNHGNWSDYQGFTNAIVDRSLEMNPDCINFIPQEYVTTARLKYVFQKDKDLQLHYMPETAWDAELAFMATTGNARNLRHIPAQFVTKEICLRAILNNPEDIADVPTKLIDEYLALTAMSSGAMTNTVKYIPPKYMTTALLMKLAERDNNKSYNALTCFGIQNYLLCKEVSSEEWVAVLKICPRALGHIAKEKQSDEMISVFFQSASLELIDFLHNKINLARIKKEHAPFLIGSKQKLFQDLVTRKLAPPERKPKGKVESVPVLQGKSTGDLVSLNLTDAEYRDLAERFIR